MVKAEAVQAADNITDASPVFSRFWLLTLLRSEFCGEFLANLMIPIDPKGEGVSINSMSFRSSRRPGSNEVQIYCE
jgi:hypothetical protein